MRFGRVGLVALLLAGGAAACGGGGDDPADSPSPSASGAPITGDCDLASLPPDEERDRGEGTEPELRQELLAMQDADQAERTGEVNANNDAERTDRLKEIIEEYGWPTRGMVGEDGASAAWLIAQHADQDPEFQRAALALMCTAALAGEADVTELGYLVDRVAVNAGEPQVYGTQIGDCEGGRAVPQPIADEAHVDERRAHVGMEPLEEYLEFFHDGCTGG
jgi:hypothetical protein